MTTNKHLQSALDSAGTAADYSARATYMRGYDAGLAAVAKCQPEDNETISRLRAEIQRLKAENRSFHCDYCDRFTCGCGGDE